jgi:hypothetical protein
VAAYPQSPRMCTCGVQAEVGLTATSNDADVGTPVAGSSSFSSTKPVQLEHSERAFQRLSVANRAAKSTRYPYLTRIPKLDLNFAVLIEV